jgi:glutathione S-transferase
MGDAMSLELIYFKACPFAQRTLIALGHLGLDCQKTLINPMDKPAWMMEVSPLGQIPLLRVDGETVLFDSSVICEYLNERAGGDLLPKEALVRAQSRMLVEFAGECQMGLFQMIVAPDEEKFRGAGEGLLKKLRWLEGLVEGDGPLFSGSSFTMVDLAYGPLFLRMKNLQQIANFYDPQELPKMSRWSEAVLAQKSVQESVDGDFSMIFKKVVKGRGKGGFVDSQIGG